MIKIVKSCNFCVNKINCKKFRKKIFFAGHEFFVDYSNSDTCGRMSLKREKSRKKKFAKSLENAFFPLLDNIVNTSIL